MDISTKRNVVHQYKPREWAHAHSFLVSHSNDETGLTPVDGKFKTTTTISNKTGKVRLT